MSFVSCRRVIATPFLGALFALATIFLSPAKVMAALAGADLSALQTLEEWGAVYRQDGKTVDPLIYLHRQGANCFRLRLFVSPLGEELVTNTLPDTLALAKRVKATGAQLILDIHYSDTWADPAKQFKPAAWKELSFDQLVETVKSYTHDVLDRFQSAGVSPDFVQLGNEITNGMLWPDGQVEYQKADGPESWSRLGELLRAAREGLDAACVGKPRPQVILHIESTSQPDRSLWFLQQALDHQVAFDIAAFSYYPEWHGGLSQLRTTLAAVAQAFHKPLLVVETAYPWKDDEHWRGRPHLDWPLSPAGQQLFLRDLAQVVQAVPEGLGLGLIYWHPESIPVDGKPCWLGGSCALFASNGEVLPAAAFAREALSLLSAEKTPACLSSQEPK